MLRNSVQFKAAEENLIENTSKKIIFQALKKMKNELDKIYSSVTN